MLKITFKKDKVNVLSCQRKDSSITWSHLKPGMELHDFAHYAVESELQLREAFFGYIMAGFDITDFEKPRDQRPKAVMPENLSLESLQTEHLVNILQTYWPELPTQDIWMTLTDVFKVKEIPLPRALTEEKLADVTSRLRELMSDWKSIPMGGTMELTF